MRYGEQIELVYFTRGMSIGGSAKSFGFGPPDLAEKIDGALDQAGDEAARELYLPAPHRGRLVIADGRDIRASPCG
jgi:hypothetical protein